MSSQSRKMVEPRPNPARQHLQSRKPRRRSPGFPRVSPGPTGAIHGGRPRTRLGLGIFTSRSHCQEQRLRQEPVSRGLQEHLRGNLRRQMQGQLRVRMGGPTSQTTTIQRTATSGPVIPGALLHGKISQRPPRAGVAGGVERCPSMGIHLSTRLHLHRPMTRATSPERDDVASLHRLRRATCKVAGAA